MILANFFSKNNQMNNVELLGEVVRYIQDQFNLKNSSVERELYFVELKLRAIKFLGEVYDTETCGVDNISLTDGYVYCATYNNTLKGALVTVRNKHKGCNLRLSYMPNKSGYINAFNFFKSDGDWVITGNEIEKYNPKKNNTFASLKDLYNSKEGIPEAVESKAYKNYKLNLEEAEYETVESIEVDSNALMKVAEKRLEEFYNEYSNVFNFNMYENLWSTNEIKDSILDRCYIDKEVLDQINENPDLDKDEEILGEILKVASGSSDNLYKTLVKAFGKFGLVEYCELQVFLMKPYLFSVLFGGFTVGVCDRLVSVLLEVGYPVSCEGRNALMVLSGYKSQNSTLIDHIGKPNPKPLKVSSWVKNRVIEVEDNLDPQVFFEKVSLDGVFKGFISWDNLYKECFIVSRMKNMNELNKKRVSKKDIDRVVSELPFTLEEKQLEAVNNCESGIVIIPGCAGSGKTTISKCISDIIGGEVGYAAPTGKAARRLSESVGCIVKTLHSTFKLGVGNLAFLSPLYANKNEINTRVEISETMIIDEAAMINLDVMFSVINVLSSRPVKLILMGDPNQLQPIGNGAIFRDLQRIFNPVKLEVSKRFASGSGVGANCKIIVEGGYNLIDADGFQISEIDTVDIKRVCVSRFLQGVKKIGIDNVQIATPYVKEEKPWGSAQLNLAIQEKLFNGRGEGYLGEFKNFSLYKGTKVVQGSVNMADKPHYRWNKRENKFESRDDIIGVFNGDVGYVVDLIDAKDVTIDNSKAISEFGDVSQEVSKGKYLVIELGKNDYILYIANKRGHRVVGKEIGALDLAYALTVHKLQGSEYQYVIFPISTSDSVNFVGNEMVYTALSRAKKYVSVIGSREKVSQALKNHNSYKIKTLMEFLK